MKHPHILPENSRLYDRLRMKNIQLDKMNKKQLIFLEPWTTPMIYKIARMFKQRGYYTVSIRILKYKFLPDSFFEDGFDEIISFNQTFNKLNLESFPSILTSMKLGDILKARKSIKQLDPYAIICRTPPNWLCALTKKFFKKIPLIYFPYDIRAQGDPRLDGYNIVARKKIIKETLPQFEVKAEKYCFEKSDGIIHKGATEELKYLDKRVMGDDFKICPLQLHFPPYCSKDFIVPLNKNKLSNKDKEIHIVTAESSGSSKSGAPASYVVDYAKVLSKQKIHLHVYVIPNVSTPKEVKENFDKNYKEIVKSKYFHFHKPLDPKEIIKEMSKYDYGAILLNLDIKNPIGDATRFNTGNKIASYMEAGIPCINYKHYEYMNKIMKKYDLSFTYKSMDDIKNLKKTIEKLNYKEIEKKILKARRDFLMEKHFKRMENFIKKVVKSREEKNE